MDGVSEPSARPTQSLILIAVVFVAAGALHLLKPAPYIRIVPPWLPAPATLVMVSGICEILGGLGVLVPATRVVAGWGLIALLVAVLPANVQMLVDAHARHASRLWQLSLVLRVPLQAALIWWVWRATSRR